MVAPHPKRIADSIRAIQARGVSIQAVQDLLSGYGFGRKSAPPCQHLAGDGEGIVAVPRNEKAICFFPFPGETPNWELDAYPRLEKCWDLDWTGTNGAIGRAFIVTNTQLLAYVTPVRPALNVPVEPTPLPFAEAQKWSSELEFLTSDTIHAASYWEFLNTPTARQRDAVNAALVERLDEWSNDMAKALAESGKPPPEAEVDEFIRRFLDQIVFARFCEDRRVVNLDKSLFELRRSKRPWPRLRSIIRDHKRILNGDIFNPDIFKDDCIDVSILHKVLLRLYQDFAFEAIPSDLLGKTYENRLSHRLKWAPPKASYVKDQELRKQYGIYYTPEPIAAYLAKRAFDIWRLRATKPLEEVKVYDPCAGSGTFLVQALRILVDLVRQGKGPGEAVNIDERAKLLGNCIFGMDRSMEPLERSALACYFEALSGQGVARGERLLPRLLGENLIKGDALDISASMPSGFQPDIILLNPPYTNSRSASSPCWKILRHCIDLLPQNGVLGTIVPDGILRNERLAGLRKYILDSTAIEEFGLIRCRVFDKPNIRPIMLLLRKVTEAHVRMAHKPLSVFVPSVEPEVKSEPIARSADQATLMQPDLYALNVHVPDAILRLQDRLLASGRFGRLKDLFHTLSDGINNPPADAIEPLHGSEQTLPRGKKPFIGGSEIKLFHAQWKRRVIDYRKTCDEAKKLTEGKKKSPIRPRSRELFKVPCKLLVRRSGSIIRACLDFGGYYVDDMTIVCLPDPDTSDTVLLHFTMGYLNSELGWLWYRMANPQDMAVMPKLRQSELEALWVPYHVDPQEMTRIAVLSHRIAQSLASGYYSLEDAQIRDMRMQLLVRLAKLLDLSEADVNAILGFLHEPKSVYYEDKFRYPRTTTPVPFVELPDRPKGANTQGTLWAGEPLSVKDQKKKDDWYDTINGPLPDIYDYEPDAEDLRIGRELEAFSERLKRIEALLKEEAEE